MELLMKIGEYFKIPRFDEVLNMVDTYACYKLAILLSLEKKGKGDKSNWE